MGLAFIGQGRLSSILMVVYWFMDWDSKVVILDRQTGWTVV